MKGKADLEEYFVPLNTTTPSSLVRIIEEEGLQRALSLPVKNNTESYVCPSVRVYSPLCTLVTQCSVVAFVFGGTGTPVIRTCSVPSIVAETLNVSVLPVLPLVFMIFT